MTRTTILISSALAAALSAVGCAPHAGFQAETFDLAQGRLHVKGWLQDGQFCVAVRFEPKTKNLSLHSLTLISATGETKFADTWKDKTVNAPPINLGLGLGIPLGGGGHGGGEIPHGGDGVGPTLAPGLSMPLGGGKKAVTAAEACWHVSAPQHTAPVTKCTLQIKLISIRPGYAYVTTVPLAMTVHKDDDKARGTPAAATDAPGPAVSTVVVTTPATTDPPVITPAPQPKKKDDPASAKKSAQELLKEIDFTLKSPPTSKAVPLSGSG